MRKAHKADAETIRQLAEVKFKALQSTCNLSSDQKEVNKIILDLLANQVEQELRIQELENEAVLENNSKLKYTELYDFAPSGCVTATKNGGIIGLNQSAAQMLRIDPARIGKNLLSSYIAEENRLIFANFLNRVFASEAKETCEVVINGVGNSPRNIVVEGIISLTDGQCLLTLVDISEQRQTLEALRLSEGQYRFMFANNPQPMWIMDYETLAFLEVNQAVVSHYGYSREKFLSMSLKDICPPSELNALLHTVQSTENNLGESSELTLLKENGEPIIVSISSCSVIYNGRPARHILVNDITDKKRIEQALLESEKHNRLLVESYTEVNPFKNDPLKDISHGYLNFLGIDNHQIENNSLDEILAQVHKDDASKIKELIQTTHLQQTKRYEKINLLRHKEAEASLEASMNFLEKVVNTLAVPIFVKNSDYQFVLVNDALCTLLGKSADQLIGATDQELFPQHESAVFNAKDQEAFETGLEVKNEETITDSFGVSRNIITTKTVYTDLSGSKFLVGVINDVTERKNNKQKIEQQNAELSKLVKDKDRFISILAHDLKSPFNALLGLSEILSTNIHDCDFEQIELYATHINYSSKKIYNLLDELLIWAQSQAGKIPYRPVKTNLAKICYNVADSLRVSANNKKVTLNILVKEDVMVYGDAIMVRTVLKNLVTNGIKYNKAGGQVDISAQVHKDSVTICVEDTGIGIKQESILKLFDISEAKTTVGTENETGTGLGLLICKDFIEKHGGKITVESEPNKGAKISFYLPKG